MVYLDPHDLDAVQRTPECSFWGPTGIRRVRESCFWRCNEVGHCASTTTSVPLPLVRTSTSYWPDISSITSFAQHSAHTNVRKVTSSGRLMFKPEMGGLKRQHLCRNRCTWQGHAGKVSQRWIRFHGGGYDQFAGRDQLRLMQVMAARWMTRAPTIVDVRFSQTTSSASKRERQRLRTVRFACG